MSTGRLTFCGFLAVVTAVGCGGAIGGGFPAARGNGGKAGARGAAGTTEAGGAQNAAGASGAAGATGTTGAAGSQGAAGATGTTGAGGAQNAAGASGATGVAGTQGAAGTKGAGGAGGGSVSTLLVDGDYSGNFFWDPSSSVASISDSLFATLLAGEQIAYTTYVVPPDPEFPGEADLASVSTVIWYTGEAAYYLSTSAAETALANWLDVGNKTLIIFSENFITDLPLVWTYRGPDTFVTLYLGLAGGMEAISAARGSLKGVSFTATGNAGIPAFSGLSFGIDGDTPQGFSTAADIVNPAAGTDTLLTVPADPTDSGTDSPTAVASAHTKGTSKIVYVGIPIEAVHGVPTETAAQLFHAVLKYTGLKAN